MNDKFIDFRNRLNNWMEDNNIKQKDLVENTGLTKGYISSVATGKRPPSKKLINTLVDMSNKSAHWWLYGKEDYDNLDSLNMLINTLIATGDIKEDMTMRKEIKEIIINMLKKEIKVKLENFYKNKKGGEN